MKRFLPSFWEYALYCCDSQRWSRHGVVIAWGSNHAARLEKACRNASDGPGHFEEIGLLNFLKRVRQ